MPGAGDRPFRAGSDARDGGPGGPAPDQARARPVAPDRTDPVARLERTALEVLLQQPGHVDAQAVDALDGDAFTVPAFRAVHEAIRAAGGLASASGDAPGRWVERVREAAAGPVQELVTELAVTPLPVDTPDMLQGYADGIVRSLLDLGITRQIADRMSRLHRLDPAQDPDAYHAVSSELLELQTRQRALRAD